MIELVNGILVNCFILLMMIYLKVIKGKIKINELIDLIVVGMTDGVKTCPNCGALHYSDEFAECYDCRTYVKKDYEDEE